MTLKQKYEAFKRRTYYDYDDKLGKIINKPEPPTLEQEMQLTQLKATIELIDLIQGVNNDAN